MALPTTMKALERLPDAIDFAQPGACLGVCERAVPQPRSGEVLVKIEASPANPSDLMGLAGHYATSPATGHIPGFEGCGRVVADNAGMLGRYLTGKRVACAKQGGDGLWAEYATVPAKLCIPVPDSFSAAQAATFIINPFTAHALVTRAVRQKAACIIQSAGASQVGRGVIALAARQGVRTISIVRKPDQIEALQALGGDVVLVSIADDFTEQLKAACKQHQPKMFFDAVAGAQTADIMTAMPDGAQTLVYGQLDIGHRIGGEFATEALIFRRQQVVGFWLTHELQSKNLSAMLRAVSQVKTLVEQKVFDTTVASTSGLPDFPEAINAYARSMSKGKALLVL